MSSPSASRLLLALLFCASPLLALEPAAPLPEPELAGFELKPAPPLPSAPLLRAGDRLAIIGDSITEQKMYSTFIETYLTVALPELGITCRQFGWGGEKAPGFLARMQNDCLRFQPTIATTCYGMNDHEYRPYEPPIGDAYRESQTAVVRTLKTAGCRVVLGSAGTVGKMPHWVKNATGTPRDLNLNLGKLRDIDIEIAAAEDVGFADVFLPMLRGDIAARQRFGPDFNLSGKDGVHPDWAGHTVMAYAFLRALGVTGEIGTFTVDFASGTATASEGHRVLSAHPGEVRLVSTRYPFCPEIGTPGPDNAIASALALIPFNEELNRLVLIVTHAPAAGAEVKWGTATKTYTQAELEHGVNLAADFPDNPFRPAFRAVWDAIRTKQAYETRQIKDLFHGPEGRADLEATVALTEKVRTPLAAKIGAAFQPVEHTLTITAKP